jgi:CRISPR-associated protein Cas2
VESETMPETAYSFDTEDGDPENGDAYCIDMPETAYSFDTEEQKGNESGKYFVLIIYDIVENKKRTKLAKMLMGFGFRIQKSAFEAMLPPNKYEKMLKELRPFVANEDSVRIYKIRGEGAVTVLGRDDSVAGEEVIII